MLLKVGELARRTGLTVRTLHHYDEIGLLNPTGRSDGGYRLYGEADVQRLHSIQALRHLGLALNDIAGVLGGEGARLALRGDGRRRQRTQPRAIRSQAARFGRRPPSARQSREAAVARRRHISTANQTTLAASAYGASGPASIPMPSATARAATMARTDR